jgi:hypothetical protein
MAGPSVAKGVEDCLFAAYITTNLTISGYGATGPAAGDPVIK